MKNALARLLNLQPEDLGRGILLFAYLFLIISSYVIGKVARDALFLDQFAAISLPYADIAIAVLVGFVVAGYLRIGRGRALHHLLVGSLIFFAANAAAFWWMAHFHNWKFTYPVIYVWVGIYGVLAPAQVWTLANYVLTTREAKRLFGLIGGGAIAGWIFGGFLTSFIAGRYNAEALLLCMAAELLLSTVLVVMLWRRRSPAMFDEHAALQVGRHGHQSVAKSFLLVWESPYLRAIAAVICLASFATTVAGWQFKAIAKFFIQDKNQLAIFFGQFNLYAAILGFTFQMLLTSRFLRNLGIGPALLAVPVVLLFGSAGVLMQFSLLTAVLLKGADQVFRYSIDKSTVELLFLPVASNIKLQVKSFIDTVIWRLGDGLAGVALLLAAVPLSLKTQPNHASWMNIVLIGGWIAAAWIARQRYITTLRDSIQQHRLDSERSSAPVLDRATLNVFAENLSPTDPEKILYALGLFQMGGQQAMHPVIRDLLSHPAAEVRKKALAILSATGDKHILDRVKELMRDPHLEVRTEALLYLSRHQTFDPIERIQEIGDFPDFSIRSAIVAFLARPGPAQNLEAASVMLDGMAREPGAEGARTRLEAARLLGFLPDEFDEQHRMLLADDNVEVACEAIRAAGQLHKRRLVFRLLDRIADKNLTESVVETLAGFGERIIGMLRDHLTDPSVPIEVRREIPEIFVRIGTQRAFRGLLENLLESDPQLRLRIIAGLNKMLRDQPELTIDKELVESMLAAEIMGHYRSYQIAATLGEGLDSKEPVAQALRESMKQEVERIFRLLALLHPKLDLHSAYVGLGSQNPQVHANALEFLDNILKPQLRKILVPLLDSDVRIEERMRLAGQMVGINVGSREEAVRALIGSTDPWLKSCGAYAIGSLGLHSLAGALDECLKHEDALLRETARQAKLRLAAAS